jgi:hypothetical protein
MLPWLWLFLAIGAAAAPCTDEQCAICGFPTGVCNTIASTCALLTDASFCEIYTCDVGACSTDLIDTCQYDNCPVPQCTADQCTILEQACDNGCNVGVIGQVCPAVANCQVDIISTGVCTANASAPNGASCDLTTTSFTCNASACNILPHPPACTDEQCATIAGAVTACDDTTVDEVCVYFYADAASIGVCTAESTCNVGGGGDTCLYGACPPPPTPPPPPPPPSCAPFSCSSADNANTKQPCTQSTDCVDTSGCGAAGACFGSVCVFAQQPCGFAYCTLPGQFNFTDFYCYYNGVNLTAPYAPICSNRADYCDPSLADCSCPSPPPTCPSGTPLCSVADDTCAARFNQTEGTECVAPATGGGDSGDDGVCSGAPILDGYDPVYLGYPCVADLSALGTNEDEGNNFCNIITGQPIYDCTNVCGVGVVNSNPYLIGPNYACFPQYVYQCDCIPPPPTCPIEAPLCSVTDDTCATRFNQTEGTECVAPETGGDVGVCSGAPILDGYDGAYQGYPCVTNLSALGSQEYQGHNFCNAVTGQPIDDCTNMCGVGAVALNGFAGIVGPEFACFPQYVYQCDCIPPPPRPPTSPPPTSPSGSGGGTLSWLPVEIMLPLAGGLVLLAAALLLATRSRGITRRGGRRRRNSATGASIRL